MDRNGKAIKPWRSGTATGWNQVKPGDWDAYGSSLENRGTNTGWMGATNHAMMGVLKNIAKHRKERRIDASKTIQSIYRSYNMRKKFRHVKLTCINLQRWYRHAIRSQQRLGRARRFRTRTSASRTICRFFKILHDRSMAKIVRSCLIQRRHGAALVIQSSLLRIALSRHKVFRKKRFNRWVCYRNAHMEMRKLRQRATIREQCAVRIQKAYRGGVRRTLARVARRKVLARLFCERESDEAARTIQRQVRRFLTRLRHAIGLTKMLSDTLAQIKTAEEKERNAILQKHLKRLKREQKEAVKRAKELANSMSVAKAKYEQAKASGDEAAVKIAKKELMESKVKYEEARKEVKEIEQQMNVAKEKLMASPLASPSSVGKGSRGHLSEDSSGEDDSHFLDVMEQAERNYGATMFQTLWRSFYAIKFVRNLKIQRRAGTIQHWWRAVNHNAKFKKHLMVSVTLRIYEFKKAEKERVERENREWREYWDNLAIKLQRIYRYYRDYKRMLYEMDKERSRLALEGRELRRHRARMFAQAELFRKRRVLEVEAAIIIQSWWRMILGKMALLKKIWEREVYATAIQSTWRRKCAYRILAQKVAAFQALKEQQLTFEGERTPYGSAQVAHKRTIDYYDPAIYGNGPHMKVIKHVRAMYEAAATYLPLIVDKHVNEARNKLKRDRQKKKKPRETIPDGDPGVLPHEFKVGDRVSVRWRDRRWSYPAVIIGVHYSNFVSQITGNQRGFEFQCFDVIYDDDKLLERHVPYDWVTAFVTRPETAPERQLGSRGFDPPDTRLTEVLLAEKGKRRVAHPLVPTALSLAEMEEGNLFDKRNHEKVKLAIHRTQQNTLGSRRGVIAFKILLGNQSTWTFRTQQERKLRRLRKKYGHRFKPSDHRLWYECASNRDLRVRVRRSTNDKLPVNVWVLKGPSVRHMVVIKTAGGWSKGAAKLKGFQKEGWTGWKSNTVSASELPQHKAVTHRRAARIDEMPKMHWTRLPYTLWAKFDAVERPISDVKISSVDYGQQNPFREEEMLFDQGYMKLPDDLIKYGLDPGTYLHIKWGENKREKEEKLLDKIGSLHVSSAKGSASTDHVLKQAELQNSNMALYYRELDKMWLSHKRLWRMVDQLALEDGELAKLMECYKDIDMYSNGYVDWDNLLHYVGFDHGDLPIFFNYLLAFFPIEDDYGRPLRRARNRSDPFRFGDFVRFLGVYCMLDSSRFEEFCFFYADTSGEGLCDLKEVNKLIEALQLSDDPKSPYRVKRMQKMMYRYFSKLSRTEPAERLSLNIRQFKACAQRFPRMTLPLHKLQYFLSRKIMGVDFWNSKKWAFMKARKLLRKEHRKDQIKAAREAGGDDQGDNMSDAASDFSGSASGSVKSGLGTSSILLKSMEMSGGTSRIV